MLEIEVCVDSVRSAIIAQQGGASRIELCTGLSVGGITPFYSLVKECTSRLTIPVNVLIRPRGGDFLYDDEEFHLMKKDVEFCGRSRCNGIVIGILTQEGEIDIQRCSELCNLAKNYSLSVTFHRAFDCCNHLDKALIDIINLGCDRILTSGGCHAAIDGVENIKRLVLLSNGRVNIMAGSGITPKNLEILIKQTGVKEIHGTFSSSVESKMIYKVPNLFSAQDYIQSFSDENILREIMRISSSF